MVTVYADASGNIFTTFYEPQATVADAGSPPGTAQSAAFDEQTNAALFAALMASPGSYTVSGTTLLNGGTPVVVSTSSLVFRDRVALAGIRDALAADSPLTAVQLRQLLRMLVQMLFRLGP